MWFLLEHPINCLQHVQSTWPRSGILRVEIVKNASPEYSIVHSYEKEYSSFELDLEALLGGSAVVADSSTEEKEDTEGVDVAIEGMGNGTEGSTEEETETRTQGAPLVSEMVEEANESPGKSEQPVDTTIIPDDTDQEIGGADDIEENNTIDWTLKAEVPPAKNMPPFRETLSEFEMFAKAGNVDSFLLLSSSADSAVLLNVCMSCVILLLFCSVARG